MFILRYLRVPSGNCTFYHGRDFCRRNGFRHPAGGVIQDDGAPDFPYGNGMIPTGLFEQRVAYLKQAKAVDLAGYHHLHTEDDVAGPLASKIQEFQETL